MAIHIIDANTFALYDFNAASGSVLPDVSGNARDMTLFGSPPTIASIQGNGLNFDGSTHYAEVIGDANWRTLLTAPWTFECWFRMPSSDITTQRDFIFSYNGSNATPGGGGNALADNTLACLGIANSCRYHIHWEFGNGTVGIDQFPNTVVTGSDYWGHMAWRRGAGAPTNVPMHIFLNGQLINTFTNLTPAAGATSANVYAHIGRYYRSSSSLSFKGGLREIRISNVARSDAEILTSYTRGLSDSSVPTVVNLNPPNGTTISPSQAISFDVLTDSANGLAAAMIWVTYSSGLVELAFDGSSLTPAFAPNSTRVPIANGHTYTLRRRGGFPAGPRISISAIGTNGLENS